MEWSQSKLDLQARTAWSAARGQRVLTQGHRILPAGCSQIELAGTSPSTCML